jgi:hypothetical protein
MMLAKLVPSKLLPDRQTTKPMFDPSASSLNPYFIQFPGHCYRVSTGTSIDARGIGFNSEPAPLSARLRPVREK